MALEAPQFETEGMTMAMLDIKGIVPALLTPAGRDGGLDLKTIPALVHFLLSRRVSGIFVAGSSGEAFFLTAAEKKALVECVVRHVDGKVPVIVHLATMDFREILDLAMHARQVGADAVSSVVPFYYTYSADEIRNYYAKIAEVSRLPLIAYALVQVMSNPLKPRDIMKALLTVDNLYGIKFTCADMYYLQQLRQHSPPHLRFYGGWDSLALPMLVMGATGLIGSQYNALPEIWLGLYQAFCRNDLASARRIHDRLTYFISKYESVPSLGRAKHILKIRGIDVGVLRPPQQPLSQESEETVRRVFEEMKQDDVLGPLFLKDEGMAAETAPPGITTAGES